MSGRTTRSRAKTSESGDASALTTSNQSDVQPPPAKQRRTQKTKKSTTQAGRKKGRLSVLPTLPLDVLFEVILLVVDIMRWFGRSRLIQIFGHLGPADLLHLARTTKLFRNVLMSRQSAFLWKEVYDAVDERDNFACPEDMSLPKWINLVHGGPFCDVEPTICPLFFSVLISK